MGCEYYKHVNSFKNETKKTLKSERIERTKISTPVLFSKIDESDKYVI